MPKMKTHSGAKKRFKKNSNGKVKITKAFRRHLLTGKSAKRKRKMRSAGYISGVDRRHVLYLLPYE
jgi:large subunit ribosomal protein L35